MWLFDRRAVVFGLIGLTALAGCGFAPAYGDKGNGAALLGQVSIDAPKTRSEQIMVQQLESRLGRADAAPYRLSYEMSFSEERMAIQANNITSRFNLVGNVAYTLRDDLTGSVLSQDRVDHFTGYSATGSTVATMAAEQDAHKRLSSYLADLVVTRLMASAPAMSGQTAEVAAQ